MIRVLLLSLLLSPALARADFYFEPYLAGGWGNWHQDRTVPPEEMELRGSSSELAFGARLFWAWKYLFLGLDFQRSQVLWTYDKMGATATDDGWNLNMKGTATGYGPVIGFITPGGFRLWYGLFTSDKLQFSSDLDPAEKQPTYQGTSNNFGISFGLGKHISIGAEYQMKKYGKVKQDGVTLSLPSDTAAGNTFNRLDRGVVYAFIGFPFDFY